MQPFTVMVSLALLSNVAANVVLRSQTQHRLLNVQAVQNVQNVARHPLSGNVAGSTFGPNKCVGLSTTTGGTCMIKTECGAADTSFVEFAFICFNPASTMPHTLHSFGRGGFAPSESYDTGVECNECTSVDFALRDGGTVLPGAMGFSASGSAPNQALTLDMQAGKSTETAFYGPSACIATFLSPQSTCMIQTRCKGIDLAAFTMGVTCLDQTGDYTRYIFGKDGFASEETFDTLIQCNACIGSGDRAPQQLNGVLPKSLVQDVNVLKSEVKFLRQNLNAMLAESAKGKQNSTNSSISTTDLVRAPSPQDIGHGHKMFEQQRTQTLAGAPSPSSRTAVTSYARSANVQANLAPAPSLASAPSGSLPATGAAGLLRTTAVASSFAPAVSALADAPSASPPATGLLRTRAETVNSAPTASVAVAQSASVPSTGFLRSNAEAPSPGQQAAQSYLASAGGVGAPVFQRASSGQASLTVRDLLKQFAH